MLVALKRANQNIQGILPVLQELHPPHLSNLPNHLAQIQYRKDQEFLVPKKASQDNKHQSQTRN